MILDRDYKEVSIQMGSVQLKGNLRLSDKRQALVIFSHGSGSSRLSVRNNYVADLLLDAGYASLLFDLLTPEEDSNYDKRFDIDLLTHRLLGATQWVQNQEATQQFNIGYFGASTGAASAICAAVKSPEAIKAVVSRGGRPDLALPVLSELRIPTLLLVGGNDNIVIGLNKQAQDAISGICKLQIIEGATHLFPEPGKLDAVAHATIAWFNTYLTANNTHHV